MSIIHLVDSRTLGFPPGVEEGKELQQSTFEEKPINLIAEDTLPATKVLDSLLMKTSYQLSSTMAMNDTHDDSFTTQDPPQILVTKVFKTRQTCEKEIAVTLGGTEVPSLFVAMTDTQVDDYTTPEPQRIVVAEEFKAQQTCEKEMAVALGTEDPSLFVAVADTQVDNYTMQEPQPTVVKNAFESLQTCGKEIPVTLNQLVKNSTLVPPITPEEELRETWQNVVIVSPTEERKAEKPEVKMTLKDCGPNEVRNNRTGQGKDLPFECSDCGKRFKNEQILSIHRRFHTYNTAKPYSCKYCGKAFSGLGGLGSHMRRHRDEETYECNVCRKKFSMKCHLNSHMRFHDND